MPKNEAMIAFAPRFNYLPVELVLVCNDTTTYKGLLPANNPSEKLFEGLVAGRTGSSYAERVDVFFAAPQRFVSE